MTDRATDIDRIASGIVREAGRGRRDMPPIPLLEHMEIIGVPGVSIALLSGDGTLVVRPYGVRESGRPEPVTQNTVFQAGSISKPVAAVAVMRHVQEGGLDLDRDVNEYLTSWQLPPVGDWRPRVTLRLLLCHGAGMTVHGFPGYNRREPVPTVPQILDGAAPANTPSVRVSQIPGTRFRYSGGGTTIVQQVLIDVLGKPFPRIMQETVLGPLGMRNSTFEQPLPEAWWDRAATGHRSGARPVDGKWHTYPEMAAAGLWTTPSDLLRVVADVQRALRGEDGALLRRETAETMLTPQVAPRNGIGFFLDGAEDARRFGHGGSDEGFIAQLVAFHDGRAAAAIMTNADAGWLVSSDVLLTIARELGWEGFDPPLRTPIDCPQDLDAYAGEYTLPSGMTLTVTATGTGITFQAGDQEPVPLRPFSPTEFFAETLGVEIGFTRDDTGTGTTLQLRQEGETLTANRATNAS